MNRCKNWLVLSSLHLLAAFFLDGRLGLYCPILFFFIAAAMAQAVFFTAGRQHDRLIGIFTGSNLASQLSIYYCTMHMHRYLLCITSLFGAYFKTFESVYFAFYSLKKQYVFILEGAFIHLTVRNLLMLTFHNCHLHVTTNTTSQLPALHHNYLISANIILSRVLSVQFWLLPTTSPDNQKEHSISNP